MRYVLVSVTCASLSFGHVDVIGIVNNRGELASINSKAGRVVSSVEILIGHI